MLDFFTMLGSPSRWPRPIRRFFVILSPLTMPLLLLWWIAIIVAVVVSGAILMASGIAYEVMTYLRRLWRS